MKKFLQVLLIIIMTILLIAGISFLFVFILAKQNKVFINTWFVKQDEYVLGVDVSSLQAEIDMSKIKEQNVDFIYIKATEGSKLKDEKFKENWDNAENSELLSGAYHFFSFDSEGETQADNFISMMGDELTGRLIPAVDIELYGDKKTNPPKQEDVVRELKEFLDIVEEKYEVKPLIYCDVDVYEKYVKGKFVEYKNWISSPLIPLNWKYQDDWYLWQYLSRGELKGYNGGEKYINLNILNKNKKIDDLIVE